MRVLIAEDNKNKELQIINFLNSEIKIPDVEIVTVDNKEDAIDTLSIKKYDFLILDMSLPKYKSDDSGIKHLAGKDILIYMKHRRLKIPTAVLTQHDVFGHHDSKVSLSKLTEELTIRFNKFLLSVIAWESSSEEWKNELKLLIEGVNT